jgi:hypothetical protein
MRSLLRHFQVLPTETIFFHASLLAAILSGLCAALGCAEWIWITIYAFSSLLIYWSIMVFFRKSGRLEAWWRDHVLSRERKRVSVGVVVILLDMIHVLNFFLSLLLTSSNILFIVERGKGVSNWRDAVYLTLMSAGISGFGNLTPRTITGHFLCILDSFIGMILIAFWVIVFEKAAEIVFRFFKSD